MLTRENAKIALDEILLQVDIIERIDTTMQKITKLEQEQSLALTRQSELEINVWLWGRQNKLEQNIKRLKEIPLEIDALQSQLHHLYDLKPFAEELLYDFVTYQDEILREEGNLSVATLKKIQSYVKQLFHPSFMINEQNSRFFQTCLDEHLVLSVDRPFELTDDDIASWALPGDRVASAPKSAPTKLHSNLTSTFLSTMARDEKSIVPIKPETINIPLIPETGSQAKALLPSVIQKEDPFFDYCPLDIKFDVDATDAKQNNVVAAPQKKKLTKIFATYNPQTLFGDYDGFHYQPSIDNNNDLPKSNNNTPHR